LTQRFANTGDNNALNMLQKLLDKHKTSHSLELQLRSVEYASVIYATKGLMPPKVDKPPPLTPAPEEDLFGLTNVMEDTSTVSSTGTVSAGVQNAAKEALTRMPVVDLKVLQKRLQADEVHDGSLFGDSPASAVARPSNAISASSGGGDLLDIFGGGDGSAISTGTIAALPAANGNKETAGKSDLDLLTDIFSAQPMTSMTVASTAYDPFSTSTGSTPAYDPFSGSMTTQVAPVAVVNPLDLFGSPSSSVPVTTTSMQQQSSIMSMNDPFAMQQPQQQQNMSNLMLQQQATPSMQPAVSDMFGATTATVAATAVPAGVRVPGLTYGGLIVEFECTKPESWNLQKSILIAHFKNTSDAPINGMNLQVAVPKHVKMEMEAPTSTTIPEERNSMGRHVSQKVTITNSMLGSKNLALKLKIGFTLKGQKYDHLATCSGFPAGEY
jgi:Adaptin C-terminal domain